MRERKRFCPKCGNPITEGVLCSDCITTELHYEPPLVQVSEFSRSFEKGRWIKFDDLETLIIRRVKEALDKDVQVELEPFEFIPQPKTKMKITAHAVIDGQSVALPVKLSYRQCDFGQKEKTNYYEGILQIQHPHDDVFEYIEQELKKVADKGIFITKTAKTKKGIDLYFTNKNYLRIISNKLVAKFGGTVHLNPQLFTRDHLASKDVYRLNALVTLPDFRKGDVISYQVDKVRSNNEPVEIVVVTGMGKLIKGKNLRTGKLVAFDIRHIKELKVLPPLSTSISSTVPDLSVIDPETYQEERVANTEILENHMNVQDKVTIVKTPYGVYISE